MTKCLPKSFCDGFYFAYPSIGLKNDALHVAEEGLQEFPDDHPVIYMGLGNAYFEMGWLEEARGILTEGLRKFPGDEGIRNLLEKIEDETDDPDKGKKPPIIELLLLLSILQKRFQRKSDSNRLIVKAGI